MSRLTCCFVILASATLGCATPGSSGTSGTAEPARAAAAPALAAVTLPAASPEFSAAARALDGEVRRHIADRGPARDGYVHGMDVATLLLYAAQRGDAELYDKLMPAAQILIQQNPDDPYTTGFVLQRTAAGAKPAQSGAAEALWMARALWTGASRFGSEADRKLALAILDGYAKHAYTLQEVWLARRSFDFRTRSFAGLSVLPAYHGDFLAQAERSARQTEWRGFAERSYVLLEHAVTPSHLLLPVIQPEIGASYPGTGLELYAPNSLSSLEDSCLGAEGATAALPNIASGLLEFAVAQARKGALRALYSTEDGRAGGELPLSGAGYACLDRLAATLGQGDALAVLDPRVTAAMQALARTRTQLPTAGPLLLAAQARGAF